MPSNSNSITTTDATLAELAATSAAPIEVEAPFTFGGVVAVAVSTRLPVPLSDTDRADFARAVKYFTRPGNKNSDVLSVNFPDSDTQTGAERATEYRGKIQKYADDMNLNAGLPKFVEGHYTKESVDAATGKVKAAKWIDANKIGRSVNVGANVTFRLSAHRPVKPTAAPVTVSNAGK